MPRNWLPKSHSFPSLTRSSTMSTTDMATGEEWLSHGSCERNYYRRHTDGGHFSTHKLYGTLLGHWWWQRMYADVLAFCKKCPECAIVTGGGRQHRPPLRPIPVQRPFQKIGVDVMDLPCTVFQDMLTKWPMVYPVPDQKTERLARLLCEEIVPMFGVLEPLLSDRGTNLLLHLMLDVC